MLTASPPELPSRYSPDLRALVVQMLEKDPSKRPGAMELIRDQTVAHFITHWLSAGLTPLGRESKAAKKSLRVATGAGFAARRTKLQGS